MEKNQFVRGFICFYLLVIVLCSGAAALPVPEAASGQTMEQLAQASFERHAQLDDRIQQVRRQHNEARAKANSLQQLMHDVACDDNTFIMQDIVSGGMVTVWCQTPEGQKHGMYASLGMNTFYFGTYEFDRRVGDWTYCAEGHCDKRREGESARTDTGKAPTENLELSMGSFKGHPVRLEVLTDGQVIMCVKFDLGRNADFLGTAEAKRFMKSKVEQEFSTGVAIPIGTTGYTFTFSAPDFPIWGPHGLLGKDANFECMLFAERATLDGKSINAHGNKEIKGYYPYNLKRPAVHTD